MTRRGVTVTQYQGPTMRFESAEAYGRWLVDGYRAAVSDDELADFAVDCTEQWDDPAGAADGQAIVDAMCEEAGL
jgi:hypothetical protein